MRKKNICILNIFDINIYDIYEIIHDLNSYMKFCNKTTLYISVIKTQYILAYLCLAVQLIIILLSINLTICFDKPKSWKVTFFYQGFQLRTTIRKVEM